MLGALLISCICFFFGKAPAWSDCLSHGGCYKMTKTSLASFPQSPSEDRRGLSLVPEVTMLGLQIFKPLSQTAKFCLISLYACKFSDNSCLGFVFLGRTANSVKNPKQNLDDSADFQFTSLASSTCIFHQFFVHTLKLTKIGLPELFIYLKKIDEARAREAFSLNQA